MFKWCTQLILLFQLLMSIFLYAQSQNPLGLPTSTPKPPWVDKLDWKHINVFRNDSIIQAYRKKEKTLKNPDKKQPYEEPYYEAYQRWLRSIRPYIQPDGNVILPPVKKVPKRKR